MAHEVARDVASRRVLCNKRRGGRTMKHKLFCTLGLMVLALVGFAANPAGAATTAGGPYYANPSWDQQLPASTRFIVLSNWIDAAHPSGGTAVLDRETGLVWEQSPSTAVFSWQEAQFHCNGVDLFPNREGVRAGNRLGWRLPTLQELASLVDPSVSPPGPKLPSGHPFSNVQSSSVYWSATADATFASNAWVVFFGFGFGGV